VNCWPVVSPWPRHRGRGYLGINPPGFAAEVVALAFGLAASSIFPALMMGIFDKRANSTGAILGMLLGLIFTLVYIFWFKGWFFIKGTEMMANTPDNWFMGSLRRPSAPSAHWSTSSSPTWSHAPPRPAGAHQHLVEDIRVPKGAGMATGH